MKKIKSFLIIAIVFILLMFSMSNICYVFATQSNQEETQLTDEQKLFLIEIVRLVERGIEKYALREMEKEYRAEKNKIPNAGDTTMLVLNSITVVSTISLGVVIVCNKKMKK